MSWKLWGKVTSVSANINLGAKMSILCKKKKKKKEILAERLTFSLSVDYYWKWLSFLQNMLIFRKMWLLCEGLYTLTKCQIQIK